ncbi:MAG: hypothetical protein ABR905_01150 [Terracidiphilus sp.]|jgi:hypothetical protein
MNSPSALTLFAAFALVTPAFALHLEPVRNDHNYPLPVVDIEDADKGVVAQLFVLPGETMKLDEKENPAAGAGFYQAEQGEVYYIVIPPRLPLPRYASNLCPCVLEVDKIGWSRDGTLTSVTGFRPFLITAAGVKIPILSDVANPKMAKSKLYFKLKGHDWGDYWVLTHYGQVVDVGGPWGPWELIRFVLTVIVPIVLGCTLIYSVAGGIVYYRADIYPDKSFIQLMQLSLKQPPFFRDLTSGTELEDEDLS